LGAPLRLAAGKAKKKKKKTALIGGKNSKKVKGSLRRSAPLTFLEFLQLKVAVFFFLFFYFFSLCFVTLEVAMSGYVPSVQSVQRSASCGLVSWSVAVVSVLLRPSRHSLSGWVCVVHFSSFHAASHFARSWARRLPAVCRGCVVRRVKGGFAVSVPVARSLGV
jgi:hypothetical protein